ncbi:MAG: glycosyltransferase family 4 protein [Flavobacteriaceae bacterium]|nr:glycosyltransferase family 4 protein [Flavobacteriaceae bacterium]MDZ4147350.1 glycosyltransferase family 4 protein [Flavobacteriaceae bacterium]
MSKGVINFTAGHTGYKTILYIGNKLSAHGKTPTGVETLGAKLGESGYRVITTSDKKNSWARLADMLFTIVRNRSKADAVLIDTYSTQNFYYALLCGMLCRLLRLPYFPVLHGGNLPTRLKNSPRMSNLLFKNSKTNIAPSNYMHDSFIKNGFQNTVCIPNFIELENYSFKERSTVAAKLLWVRSFKEIYHPEMAIEVAHLLKTKGYKVSLCMVGPAMDDTYPRCVELAQTLKIGVRFTGRLSKPEWAALSREYDIFINTTHLDNLPVSVLEAMALGMPVVSTDVGGISALIVDDKNGLLCPDNDAETMAQQMIRLIENPILTAQISRAGRLTAEEFAWEKVKSMWEELLN